MSNTAQDAGLRLAIVLEGLQALANAWNDSEPETDGDLLDALGSEVSGTVKAEALDLFEELGGHDDIEDAGGPVWAWASDLLEITGDWRGGNRSAVELREVRALVTYGGPNLWAISDGDTVRVEAFWGGESWSAIVDAPTVAAALWDMVEA